MTDSALRFGAPANGAAEASDSDFIAAVRWRSSSPGIGSELGEDSDVRAIGMCWKHHCLSLAAPRDLDLQFRTLDELPLDGGLLTLCVAALRDPSLKKKQKEATAEHLDAWLAENAEVLVDPLALLACCELLVLRADALPAATIGRLWRATLCAALDLSGAFENAAATDDWDEPAVNIEDESTKWISGGLVPWVCGLLFDEVKGAPKLARAARAAMHDQLVSVAVDGGCPDGTVLDGLPVLLSVFHDAVLVGELFERRLWRSPADRTWRTLLEKCSALVASDGHLAGEAAESTRGAKLLASAVALAGETGAAWAAPLADTSRSASGRKKQKKKKPESVSASGKARAQKIRRPDIPSWQSDDAEVACLRTTWDADASLATVTHHGDLPFLELAIDGVPLLRGDWGVTVAEDGEWLEFEAAWENVCWHSEPTVDYCEIQFEFESGPKICRHVMLCRQRQFAIISDVVSETSAKELLWETRLPLAEGVTVKTVPGTREYILSVGSKTVGSKTARVFPLILPQDLGEGTAGAVGVEDDEDGSSLTVRHPSTTGALFAPIVIDWSRDNRKAEAEWKKLTTTTAGEIDLTGSSAYRLQFGKQHLMLYRSLVATKRYRAMLGYQTDSETILADFKDGDVDEIVMVE
jgi:hypothetical protein